MQLSAVYACVQVISKTIASLPLVVFKERPDGGADRAPNHPLFKVLHSQPNSWQTSFEFRQMMQAHLLLRGNAYAQIVPGPRGFVDQLLPLHPDRVRVKRLENGRLLYEVAMPSPQPVMKLTQDEMFHLRGLSSDGIVGRSVIDDYAFQTVGAAIATQEYGARFMQNNATPAGVLETPAKLEEKAWKHLEDSWKGRNAGENQNGVRVLEQDLKFHAISITNRDAQVLEIKRFQVSDIARIFGVPPHKIGDLDRATFSNIEQQNIEFATDTIRPWCVCWEQRMERDLFLESEQDTYSAEFVMQGLLRGDTLSRFEAYQIGLQNKVYTPNEVRALENLNPIPGGDEPIQPLNMVQPGQQPPSKKQKQSPKRPVKAPTSTERIDFSVDGAGEAA